ncbi:hypothetical protein AHF37_08703 [Paragonimus kellicotti]|nr:hypothetical protein AHF37_08703 [Paragonimus kellicotti]
MDDPKWNTKHRKFHDRDSGAFTQFALHLETNSAFLGANNSVVRLDIKTLEKVDQVIWSSSRELTEACKMKTGSGAADLRGPPKILWSGLNQCPAKPNEPVIATAATNRQLYMGTRFTKADTSIIAIESVSASHIRTNLDGQTLPYRSAAHLKELLIRAEFLRAESTELVTSLQLTVIVLNCAFPIECHQLEDSLKEIMSLNVCAASCSPHMLINSSMYDT